jgi:hypothetical protein
MQRSMFAKLVMATLPLALGGLTYVAFRTDSLLMFQWFAAIGLGAPVWHFREAAAAFRPPGADVLLFSAPNGLWLLSYCMIQSLIWRDRPRTGGLLWVCILYVVAVGSEIFQLLGLLSGRFDIRDLAAYTVAALLGVLLLTSGRTRHV